MVKLIRLRDGRAGDLPRSAAQIFGGAGYTTLHPIERYWRDAPRLTKIFEEHLEKIQQRIIADALLGKPSQRGSN